MSPSVTEMIQQERLKGQEEGFEKACKMLDSDEAKRFNDMRNDEWADWLRENREK
jgi:hypothetical protein